MNKSRKLSLINMCVNFAVIVMEVVGLYFLTCTAGFSIESLKYYTVLTGFVTLIAAALMIWANIVSYIKKKDCTPRLFYSMRFLSAVMSLLTFITVAVFLAPDGGMYLLFGLESGCIFFHFLCPIISVIQFVGFEIESKGKFKKTLEPFIATVIYAVAIIITIFTIQNTQGVQAAKNFAPYFFFKLSPDLAGDNFARNIGVAFGVLAISYIASVLLWTLNRISHNIFIGEVLTASKPKTAPKKKAVTAKGGNAFTNYVKKKVAFTGDESTPTGGQTYHISYHDRRLKTWKVKSENAGRALKVFPTQKEAIAFANEQVKKNGGSIRVHSMVGQIRKE